MNNPRFSLLGSGGLAAAMLLAACGGGAAPASTAPASSPAAASAAPSKPAASPAVSAASSAKPAASAAAGASAKPAASGASAKPAASGNAAASVKSAASGVKTLKLAVPQGDTLTSGGLIAVGINKGYFKDEGLDLQTTTTTGGATNVQAVVSGSVDMAMATGMFAIMTAFTKDAPVQIVASDAIGVSDLYWYVKPDSAISKVDDFAGKKVAFTNRGSSSNLADEGINDILKGKSLKPAELVPVGGFPDQLTAVKTGQVDVGLAGAPAILSNVAKNEVKIVFTGKDITSLANETIRGQFVNTKWSAQNGATVSGFLRAYDKTWKYMAANKQDAVKIWKEAAKLQDSDDILLKAFDYYPEEPNTAQAVKGVDLINKQAVDYKAIDKPLTQDELSKLITTQYLPK
jgi:NitT/TauT family transport system substrate-binding protein